MQVLFAEQQGLVPMSLRSYAIPADPLFTEQWYLVSLVSCVCVCVCVCVCSVCVCVCVCVCVHGGNLWRNFIISATNNIHVRSA